MIRSALRAGVLVGGFVVALSTPSAAQNAADYTPPRLADGQPDITGMWNNSRAMFTPLELPEALAGKELSADELQARAEARGAARIAGSEWKGHENSRGVGGYGTYWFDWYWEDIQARYSGRFPPESPTNITEALRRIVEHNEGRSEVFFTYKDAFLEGAFDLVAFGDLYRASVKRGE